MAMITRRGLLIGGAVAGGTLAGAALIGVGFLSTVDTKGLTPGIDEDGTIHLNAWLTIGADDRVRFAIPRVEMGQGVFTSLPMLIAEEMGLPLDGSVEVYHPSEQLPMYANWTLGHLAAFKTFKRPENFSGPAEWTVERVVSLLPFIGTGGSTSIIDAYVPLRRAGAAARELLKQAAAKRLGVPVGSLMVERGAVIDPASGETLRFGDLAGDAAKERPPATLPLKPRREWKMLGRPYPRLDIPAKVTGKAVFGIDAAMDQPELLFAAVAHAPVFGATLAGYNASRAEAMDGVEAVVDYDDTTIAVVARDTWTAKRALEAVDIRYTLPESGVMNSDDISAVLAAALQAGKRHITRNEGDVDSALAGGQIVRADYETPYLAHATMEPMNATARITAEQAEVWAPQQMPTLASFAVAESRLAPKQVAIHTTYAGGGFGRRAEKDFTHDAVQIASRLPGRLVKVVWSREEDMQHDMYRPAAQARMAASLSEDGRLKAVDITIAAPSIAASHSGRNMPVGEDDLEDMSRTEGATEFPYAAEAVRVAGASVSLPVPIGYWRSVGHSNNAFFVESFIDELAEAAGIDPFDFRQRHLAGHPRLAPLAAKLRQVSGWDSPLAEGRARGVAIHESFQSYVGQVAEILVRPDGGVLVEKVTCVADLGTVINPDTAAAQMESGIIFGLTAALYGEITLKDGRVEQRNFPDYEMIRLASAPAIAVTLMSNEEAPGGAGEPSTPPSFAALTNAIARATGKRIRRLPIHHSDFYAL